MHGADKHHAITKHGSFEKSGQGLRVALSLLDHSCQKYIVLKGVSKTFWVLIELEEEVHIPISDTLPLVNWLRDNREVFVETLLSEDIEKGRFSHTDVTLDRER